MTADPRLLVPLADLPGLDPVGLRATVSLGVGGPISLLVGSVDDEWVDLVAVADRKTESATGAAAISYRRVAATIDLSDAATRDRCLRWLAGRVGLADGYGAGTWTWRAPDPGQFEPGHVAVCHLDPTDETRLPDGRLRVHVQALAAVLRHVAGAA